MDLHFDVLIIGTGIAGLSAACKLAENHLSVGIITKELDPSHTNTSWAQGGIIYSKGSEETLIEDILKASAETSNKLAAHELSYKSSAILEEILIDKAKTHFERNDDTNQLKFTKEAAHSCARIIYRGDFTGKEIQTSLINYIVSNCPTVTFLKNHTAIDLLTPLHHGKFIGQRYEENQVIGAYVFDQTTSIVKKIIAKKTILATGGVASLYLHHSNTEGARGDGHAMARRAGAQLIDMEFIQFHPTTFYGGSTNRRFLISEAVRGEGGVLLNNKHERFMKRYHRDQELAPRDIVARAIAEEMIESQSDSVFLDITHKTESWISDRFPTIYEHCKLQGINISNELIPVVPAAHYTCGGIKTNLIGQTSIHNLYAVGEVACTGLHGANRLASTSLLEGLTFAQFAAEEILKTVATKNFYPSKNIKDWVNGIKEVDNALIHQDASTIKQTMWNYVGLTRSKDRLLRAEAMFRELSDEINRFYKDTYLTDGLIGLRNSVEVCQLIISASQRNNQSVGCFYRKS